MTLPVAIPFGRSLVLDRGEPLPLVLLDRSARAAWEASADRRAETERLLAIAVGQDAPVPLPEPARERWRGHARSSEAAVRRRVYRFGGPAIAVSFRPAGLEALVRDRFRHLCDDDAAPEAELTLEAGDDGFTLCEPGGRNIAVACPEALIGAFVRRVVELSNPGSRWNAVLHAAAVGRPDAGAIVMPGQNGSGKSMLTLALLEAGWQYLSDDCVPIDQTGCAVPAPFSICLKESGWAAAVPHPGRTRPVRGRNGERCRFVPPCSILSGPAPIRALVFPRYRPDAPAAVTRLAPEDALQRLLKARAWIARHASNLPATLGLIEGLPAFALEYGSSKDALALITDIVARQGAPAEDRPNGVARVVDRAPQRRHTVGKEKQASHDAIP